MRRKVQPLGDCYRWAYNYIFKHGTALLHHGYVNSPFSKNPAFPHAWVTHNGLVKDWQTMVAGFGGKFRGLGYPEAVYAELWHPTRVHTFTQEEALIAAGRSEHYGPWTAKERGRRALGEYDDNIAVQNFPKRCSCGRAYTQEQWLKLPGKKIWELPWGEVQELRNCPCRSTMAIVLVEGDPE